MSKLEIPGRNQRCTNRAESGGLIGIIQPFEIMEMQQEWFLA